MSKPKALVVPSPRLYHQLFTPENDARLQSVVDVTFNDTEDPWNSAELARRIPGYEIVITGWGSPTFTDEVLDAADRLRLIVHSAGTIKKLLPPPVFARGIAVTHSAAAMAPAVAEMSMLLILLCLRQVHRQDRALHDGATWDEAHIVGRELIGQRVGVVGAGHTGRAVIRLLTGWGAQVVVHDPYLSADRAAEWGVTRAGLDELFATCPIVTMQAPPTDETYHMVGAAQLALLQDGAVFVNTARSHTVDQDALVAELRRGRIQAALDVYDQEPLPLDSPFRQLDNVVLTPHVASATTQCYERMGAIVTDEVAAFLRDGTLRYRVTADMLPTMA